MDSNQCIKWATVICFFAAVLAIPTNAATTYYVNGVTGNDNNPGTAAQPVATITEGVSKLSNDSGDTLKIQPGTYRERVSFNKFATSEANRLTVEPNGTGTVVIKGSDIFSSWTSDTGRYRTDFNYSFANSNTGDPAETAYNKQVVMVFVDGTQYQQVMWLTACTSGSSSFYLDPNSSPNRIFIGTNPSGHTVEITTRQYGFDCNWVSYPSQDVEYVTFNNIKVTHVACGACSDWRASEAFIIEGGHVILNGCEASYNNWHGFGICGNNHTVQNCTANYNGDDGMTSDPNTCTFINNTTNYNGWRYEPGGWNWDTAGMKWTGGWDPTSGTETIHGNTFENCVSSYNQGPGIWFDWTAGNTIEGCTFDNNKSSGVKFEDMFRTYSGFDFYNNIISNTCASATPPSSPEDGAGLLIYNTSNCDIYFNTIVGNAQNGIDIAGGEMDLNGGNTAYTSYDDFYDNIIADNNGYGIRLHTWASPSWDDDFTHQFDYNLYYGNSTNVALYRSTDSGHPDPTSMTLVQFNGITIPNPHYEVHGVITDPKFVNAPSQDYHLSSGSGAIDTGVDMGITTDKDGVSRPQGNGFDIGAYEYVTNTFYPTKDNYISQAAPSSPFGSATNICIEKSSSSNEEDGVLQFSVTGISGTVTSAKLYLKTQSTQYAGNGKIYSITGDWTESTLSWNSGFSSLTWGSLLDTNAMGAANTWYSWNVGSVVTGNGTYSFGLKSDSTTQTMVSSKEDTSNKPYLVITCTNTFNPTKDNYVSQAAPSSPFGSATNICIEKSSSSNEEDGVLQFSVTGVTGTVTSAKLYLKTQSTQYAGNGKIYSITGDWTESTLSWNSGFSSLTWGSLLDTNAMGAASTWYSWNVASVVTGNGTYSFGLKSDSTTQTMVSSKEDTSNKPYLVITYGPPGSAPGKATSPTPANSATGQSITQTLSWTADAGATSHDVYFGTSSPGTFQGNQAGTTFNPGALAANTTYYWRIDEKNSYGTTTGDVWSFTTAPAPGQATSPNPSNSATGVSITKTLSWTAGSNTTGNNVYFGTSSSPPEVTSNQGATTYNPGTMVPNTTYYWRIDEVGPGGTTTGTVWSFTTHTSTTTSFNPTKDNYVSQAQPNSPFGSATNICIEKSSSSNEEDGVLQFSVTGISGTVTSAKLYLKTQSTQYAGNGKIYSITGDWTESTLAWNSGFNSLTWGSLLDTNAMGAASTWYSWNVASVVTGNGTYSFGLKSDSTTQTVVSSKEDTSNKPYLQITYAP